MGDITAERSVLAGIFKHGYDAYIDVSDILEESTFTHESNKVIWRCVDLFFKTHGDKCKHVDVPSIQSVASNLGIASHFEKPFELSHLRAVLNFGANVRLETVRRLAGKIKKIEIAQRGASAFIEAADQLKAVTGDETPAEIIGMAENPIFKFSESLNKGIGVEGPKLISTGLREYVQHLAENPVEQIGISSGYKFYDAAIGGGFRKKTVNVVAARPKGGKSVFAANVIKYIAGKLKYPCLYLDTEMCTEDQQIRIAASVSGVKINRIETGQFKENPEEYRAVQEAVAFLENSPYHYFSIAGQPFEDTISFMRRWILKEVGLDGNGEANPCLIVFDYIKLMSDGLLKNLQEYQAIGFMLTSLHNFMVKYGPPCLAFVQLNKEGAIAETAEVVSQSDRIAWLCSNLSIFKSPSIAELTTLPPKMGITRKLVPIMARHGKWQGDETDYIAFRGDFSTARLEEVGVASQLISSSQFQVDETNNGESINF